MNLPNHSSLSNPVSQLTSLFSPLMNNKVRGEDMKDRDVLIGSYDNSKSRASRLYRVIGFVKARMYDIDLRIIALYDHKGCLEVSLDRPISKWEKNHFLEVWESSLCGECSSNVRFSIQSMVWYGDGSWLVDGGVEV